MHHGPLDSHQLIHGRVKPEKKGEIRTISKLGIGRHFENVPNLEVSTVGN